MKCLLGRRSALLFLVSVLSVIVHAQLLLESPMVSENFKEIKIFSKQAIGETSVLGLEWESNPDAVEYEIQVARDKGFANFIKNEKVKTNRFSFQYPVIQGSYYWRVRVVGRGGAQSRWSPRQSIQIQARKALDTPKGISPQWKENFSMADPNSFEIDFITTSVPHADEYLVQFASDKNFTEDVHEHKFSENRFTIENAFIPGKQFWRVKALSAPKRELFKNYTHNFDEYVKTSLIPFETDEKNIDGGFWANGTQVPFLIDSEWSPTYRFNIEDNYLVVFLDSPKDESEFYFDPSSKPFVELRWKQFDEHKNYRLQVSPKQDFSVLLLDRVVEGNLFSWRNIKLGEDQYFWRVKVDKGEGSEKSTEESLESEEITSTTTQENSDKQWKWSQERVFYLKANLPRPALISPANEERFEDDGGEEKVFALQFSRGEFADYYEVQLGNNVDFSPGILEQDKVFDKEKEAYITYKTKSDLPKGWIYWRARAVTGEFRSDWSKPGRFYFNKLNALQSPLALTPAEDKTFRAKIDQNIPVLFSWNSREGDEIRLQVSSKIDFSEIMIDEKVSSQLGKKQLEIDFPEGDLYWRMQSSKGRLQSKWSAPKPFKIEREFDPLFLRAPASETVITQWAHVDTKHRFTWQDQAGISKFHIQVANNPDFIKPFVDSQSTDPHFDYKGRLPAGESYWRVRSLWRGVDSDWSQPFKIITNKKISTPELVAPINQEVLLFGSKKTRLEFEWKEVPEAEGFEIQLAEDEAFTKIFMQKDVKKVTKASIDEIIPSGNLYWRVRSRFEDVVSSWSPHARIWGKRIHRLDLPQIVGPTNNSKITLNGKTLAQSGKFEWKPVPHALLYRIEIAKTPLFNEIIFQSSSETQELLPEEILPLGHLYWRMRAEHYDAHSLWTEPQRFTLEIPLTFELSSSQRYYYSGDKEFVEVELHWSAHREDTSYLVEVSQKPDFSVIDETISTKGGFGKVVVAAKGRYYWRVLATSDQLRSTSSESREVYNKKSDIEWFYVHPNESFRATLGYGLQFASLEQNVSRQSDNVRDGSGSGSKFGSYHVNMEYWFLGPNNNFGLLGEMNYGEPKVNFIPATVYNSGDITNYTSFSLGLMAGWRKDFFNNFNMLLAGGFKRVNRHLIRREDSIFVAEGLDELYFSQEGGIEYSPLYGRYYFKAAIQFIERVNNLDTWAAILKLQAAYRYEFMSFGVKYELLDQTLNFRYTDAATNESAVAETLTRTHAVIFNMGFNY